jgi:phosphoglycerate dehydrogenase-like enzyme
MGDTSAYDMGHDADRASRRHKVVYLTEAGEPIYAIMREVMPPEFQLLTPGSRSRTDLLGRLPEADFVITVAFDAGMIAAARRLKLIQLAGVGFDSVDVRASTEAGIPVAQTVEGTIIGVAEHTLLLTVALLKHLVEADASVRRGEWLVWQLRPTSYLLYGKTVGIFGLGRIGREVARRFRAFGANIIYTDLLRAPPDVERELSARFVPLEELARICDVLSIHAPLSPETRHVFGEEILRQMKPTAVLINTARGPLVDERALTRALQDGWIQGAGLDVFDREPPAKANPLLALKNVILSPHCATGTRESIIEKTQAACDNFRRVIEGRRPINVINPEVFARGASVR